MLPGIGRFTAEARAVKSHSGTWFISEPRLYGMLPARLRRAMTIEDDRAVRFRLADFLAGGLLK